MIAFKRRNDLWVLLVLCTALIFLSCSKQPAGPPKKTREQLIAQLLDKAAHTTMGTRQTAYAAYHFAAFYAPQDQQIQAKWEEAKKMPVGIINAQDARDYLADWVAHEDMLNFPASTPETDRLNLEMLNDERLVGDLSYGVYSISRRLVWATFPNDDVDRNDGDQVCVFTSEPNYTTDEVRKIYGEPTVANSNPNILTYGRMRVIASTSGNTGKVKVVVFPLFPK